MLIFCVQLSHIINVSLVESSYIWSTNSLSFIHECFLTTMFLFREKVIITSVKDMHLYDIRNALDMFVICHKHDYALQEKSCCFFINSTIIRKL